jgi:hypothetical protein
MNSNNQNTNTSNASNSNQDRPALCTITESGTYRLRLCNPKIDKITQTEEDAFVKLFFLGESGLCLSKKYSTKYPMQIATLVGKLTKTYKQPLKEGSDAKSLFEYIQPAVNKWADISLEVSTNEWNGKTYYKYKFLKIEAVEFNSSDSNINNSTTETTPPEALPF